MRLMPGDQPWAPENKPDYLCPRQPRNKEGFLLQQADLLRRLVQEANPQEVKEANNRLRDNLPQSFLLWQPLDLLDDPHGPHQLFLNPAELGSKLEEWKSDVPEALKLPPMSPQEAAQHLQDLSLDSYLDRLV